MSLLKEQPKVSSAAIYDAKGTVFASYWRAPDGQPVFPATAQSEGYRVEGKDVVLFKRITANDKSLLGTVYLKASYELRDRLQNYLAILGAVLATSLLVAMLMTSWLQKSVTEPIMAMTDVARQISLVQAVRYLVRRGIAGSFVECGVWRGGSSMAVALTLAQEGDTGRDLYLYDTFEGMTPPTDADRTADGTSAQSHLDGDADKTGYWCVAGLE